MDNVFWNRGNHHSSSSASFNNKQGSIPEQDAVESLFVFGYSCKLFRDDEKFKWINNGGNLIPWMGQQDHLIDRYDVRGYLNDMSEILMNKSNDLTEEERVFQNTLNAERFMDLDEKQQTENAVKVERSPGFYSNVGYCYDKNADLKRNEETTQDKIAGDDYKMPSGLKLPGQIVLPKTMKLHQVIEKTAMFVAKNGLQMEILLKTKQASNSNFEFLSIDSELNPYYKHLLSLIKSGNYEIKSEQGGSSDNTSDSESDDNYLHPSLLQSSREFTKESDFKIPNLKFIKSRKNDAYSQLVENFKNKFAEDIGADTKIDKTTSNNSGLGKNKLTKSDEVSAFIPNPPPKIEMIIEKLAQHVGQNGEDFEVSIKALNDGKFDFLNSGNRYHAYYVKRKVHHINQFKAKEFEKQKISKDTNKKAIVFPLNAKEPLKIKLKDNETVQNHLSGICQIQSSSPTHSISFKEKRLQEIRKKKAMEFVKMLRRENRLSASPQRTFGPELPQQSMNTKLSPTIIAVTSPPNSPTIDELLDHSIEENFDKRSLSPTETLPCDRLITHSPRKRHREVEKEHRHRHRSSSRSHSSRYPSERKRSRSRSTERHQHRHIARYRSRSRSHSRTSHSNHKKSKKHRHESHRRRRSSSSDELRFSSCSEYRESSNYHRSRKSHHRK